MLDATHDPARRSWVASAEGHARVPARRTCRSAGSARRAASPAPGSRSATRSWTSPPSRPPGCSRARRPAPWRRQPARALNGLLALGAGPRRALRARLFALLSAGAAERAAVEPLLHRAADCAMHLPAAIGDYTDFYVGIHHATNVGKLFRPDNPLLPNYKWVPIGYHGRASTIRPSGVPVRRPSGPAQAPGRGGAELRPLPQPRLRAGARASGSAPATSTAPRSRSAEAAEHVAGYCLLNDWSARDVQAWEYQPLGPFLSKSFHTTISPWIVTPEALAPFRTGAHLRPAPLRPSARRALLLGHHRQAEGDRAWRGRHAPCST